MSAPLTASTEPLPLNRIRVETALSRFPIHRLAKKGTVAIDLERLTEAGTADFRWEVTYNSKHGQPGPLAYKVDTLVVNRRIDELGRPLPELIKIGSMSDVCRGLGSADSGQNIADLKRAFLQNASAFINAKIRYKTKTGRERWGEIGYTRYSVIFTGETLPDGRQADAVYIVLNPPYRDLLNHVEVRPLDYDYLMRLAPGPQRFYELLSFQIYGALASGRARAKMLYSEYCKYAPQTRYPDFEHAKKQMWKVHQPHRESGYIAGIDYQATADQQGNADWEMLYTPGPKATAEFEAFTNRQIRQQTSTVSTPAQPPVQMSLPESPNGENELLEALTGRGIAEKKARDILANLKPGQSVFDQLRYVDQIIAQQPRKFRNPAGFYVKFIEDNTPVPEAFRSTQNTNSAEANYDEHTELDRLIAALPAGEYQRMFDKHYEESFAVFGKRPSEDLSQLAHAAVVAELLSAAVTAAYPGSSSETKAGKPA